MTREDKKELYKLEVKNVAELLYTLAGLAEEEEEKDADLFGRVFSGYDLGELREVAKGAKKEIEATSYNKYYTLSEESRRLMTRRVLRDEASFLVAKAIARRGEL